MQRALQFCNVNHAMVALDPWFLPIIKMEKKKLGKCAMTISILVSNKTLDNYVYEFIRCKVSITLLEF